MSYSESSFEGKVEDLNTNSRRVNITVRVESRNPVREVSSRSDGSTHKVTEVLVGDETGCVFLTLWDDNIEKINDGDTIKINNGYVSLFRGSMRLNIGRYGSFEAVEEGIEEVKTDNNLSDKQYEQERRYSRSGGGGGGRYGSGGRRDYRGRRSY
jgi:replication factor A1